MFETLRKDEILLSGSLFEVEIRGCSIRAVDLIVERITTASPECKGKVNAMLVDYFLWGFRREKADEMNKFPYHKTRSVYY